MARLCSFYITNFQERYMTTRREFIKHASLGAASLAIPGLACAKDDGKKLGIALVGLGYYSTDVLAPALQVAKDCYLAGIVTGTPAKEKIWAEKYQIPTKNIYTYDNFDKIKDNPDIDIVYIVLPNSMHREFTIRAAAAGKHVICEKPMALNVQECQDMINACKKANRLLAIGYRMQHEPHTQEIIRFAREKTFGKVLLVCAGAGYREGGRPEHWKMKRAYGGGSLMDMGVYSIQGARYSVQEEPIAVTAQAFKTRPDYFAEMEETVTFQLEFPSGAVANCHTSHNMNMNYLHVSCEQGWYELLPFQSYGGIAGRTNRAALNFPAINQQAAQMDDVTRCIRENKPVLVPGEEGLRDIKIVEAIRKAIETGGRVMI